MLNLRIANITDLFIDKFVVWANFSIFIAIFFLSLSLLSNSNSNRLIALSLVKISPYFLYS